MIEMYSLGAAYQTFFEDVTGSLKKGKSADFVILDQRITDTDPEDLDSICTKEVYFKGNRIL